MKSGDGWQDVAISNVSAHGMRISVAMPPRRGAFIEIRRASQVIVARAVWVEDHECGLRTQDTVDITALLNPNAARAEAVCTAAAADRRRGPRADDVAARSQRFSARFQQVAIAAAVVCAAGYLASSVGDVLRTPFASVTAALDGKPIATEDAVIKPID